MLPDMNVMLLMYCFGGSVNPVRKISIGLNFRSLSNMTTPHLICTRHKGMGLLIVPQVCSGSGPSSARRHDEPVPVHVN